MPTRAVEVFIRLMLGVLGLGAIIVIFTINEANPSWSSTASVLVSLPLAAVGIYGVLAAIELRDKPRKRDLLQFRRLGKREMTVVYDDPGSSTEIRRPMAPDYTQPASFGLKTRSSWVALGLGLIASLVGWNGALAAFNRTDPFADAGFAWILLLPLAVFVAVRSAVRIVLSSRAVVTDRRGLRLGIALGFAWPLQIRFEEVGQILIVEDTPGPEFLVLTADGRSYHIDVRHLADPAALSSWLTTHTNSGGGPIVREKAFVDPGPTLSRPIPTAVGQEPPPETLAAARRVLRRRVRRMGTVFIATVLFSGLVGWQYMNLRHENDLLDANGSSYIAEVLRVDNSSRGVPGEIHARFSANGQGYDRIISSRWFRDFDRSLQGTQIDILFDPETAGMAKLPGSRNYPTWLGMGFLVAAAVLPFSALAYSLSRKQTSVLTQREWQRVNVSAAGKRDSPVVVRRNQDEADQTLGNMWGRGSEGFNDHGAWMISSGRTVLLLPDNSPRVLATTVGKRSPLIAPTVA